MRIILIIICIGIGVLAACKKNSFHVTERDVVANAALLKVGYFCPGISNNGVQLKVNGTRLSNNLLYPIAFPGGGLNTGGSSNSDYLQLPAGETNIEIAVPKFGTDEDSVAVLSYSQALEANKRYTFFTTDSVPNATGVMVEDDVAAPDTTARIKFLHLIPNVPAVDFYQRGKLIAANVAYKGVTEYFDITFGSDTFSIRAAGSAPNTPVIAFRVIATSRQRIYTFFSRGYRGATGTRAPNVSALIVQ